jgi:hypothetical protein
MWSCVPEIHILEDRIEVYASGIRRSKPHTTRKIMISCTQSSGVNEVLQHLLFILKSKGYDKVKICINNVCRLMSLC